MKTQIVYALGAKWHVARIGMIAATILFTGVVVQVVWLLVLLAIYFLLRGCCVRRGSSNTFGSARLAERADLAGMLTNGGLPLGRAYPERRARLWKALVDLVSAPLSRSREVCYQMLAALAGRIWEPRPPILYLNKFTHVLAVAPSGAGKNVSLVFPMLLTWARGSVCVLDPKGESFNLTSLARKAMGQEIYRLDPFNLCGPNPAKFNPLDMIDPASPRALNDCAALAEAMVVRGQETDSHWSDCAAMGLSAFLYYVACTAKPSERNLLTVRELITDEDAWTGSLIDMRQSDIGALRRLGGQMARWQDKELASILSAMNRHLQFLDSPLVSSSLSGSDFDPADLVNKPMTIYIILPPDQLQPLARLMRLWLTSFMRRLAQGPLQETNLVLFLLDEVGNLGEMAALKNALTVLRSYGVRMFFLIQSLGMLHTLFPGPKGYQTAAANFDTQIYFGIRDHETAEAVSAYIGDYTTHSRSEATTTGTNQPTFLALLLGATHATEQSSNSTSVTRTEVGRRLFQASEILQLPERTALILTKGVPPIAARLVRYYEDPEFFGLAVPTEAETETPPTGIITVMPGPFLTHSEPGELEELAARTLAEDELPAKTTTAAPAIRRSARSAPAGKEQQTIRLRCLNCKQFLRVPRKLIGRKGKCKGCGTSFKIRPR